MADNKKDVAYTIGVACIGCGKCYEKCPAKAISFKNDIFRYDIDKSICIKCGLCYRGCVYNCITKTSKKVNLKEE